MLKMANQALLLLPLHSDCSIALNISKDKKTSTSSLAFFIVAILWNVIYRNKIQEITLKPTNSQIFV